MIGPRSARESRRARRRGFGLIEMAVAGVLIAVAMALTVQIVGWVALERRAVARRERALREAENLLERAVAGPWEGLSTESTRKLRVSPGTAAYLHEPRLSLEVTPSDEPPARKKITVEIRWLDRSGRPEAPVRLVAWAYRRKEADR